MKSKIFFIAAIIAQSFIILFGHANYARLQRTAEKQNEILAIDISTFKRLTKSLGEDADQMRKDALFQKACLDEIAWERKVIEMLCEGRKFTMATNE